MPNQANDREVRLAALFSELRDGLSQFQNCPVVEINTQGFGGDTPLKVAVVRQDLIAVTDLLIAGANPNIQGEDDCTPLHHAAGSDSEAIVRLLLGYGASTQIRDRYGNTPIEYASSNQGILNLLTAKNA